MGVQELRFQFWILYNPSEYSNRTLKKLEQKKMCPLIEYNAFENR